MNLSQLVPLYQSLIDFSQFVRDNFDLYEDATRKICGENITYAEIRKKVPPRSKDLQAIHSDEVQMTARQAYISNIHYVICDVLISHLSQRKEPYTEIANKFACFMNLKSTSVLHNDSVFLQNCYPSDLGDNFPDELQQFQLEKLKKLHLDETFPNVETALRIFFTLPVSNCSGERSFSLLNRIKSPVRSTLLQNKLSSLALLCIEGKITEKLDYNDVIRDFAAMKTRKKFF